jgi:hypothetical protein
MIVAVAVGHELWRALSFAFGMTWEVLWALGSVTQQMIEVASVGSGSIELPPSVA